MANEPDRDLAVRVDGVSKTFRLPRERVHTLKERVLHPLRRQHNDVLHALEDVSFVVQPGEFFGIVGRNGSGKSTLLKCLAGIYPTDGGDIYVDGRLSTFIELGVGFNMDLAARDNVLINATMLGLSPREARRRFDRIIEFAELEDFVDLKIKNYSSGMLVRLAFAIMVQADADIMLVDEVLAVGDAAFAQKCLDVFRDRREAGKTVVLVTHDMAMVQDLCDRAMLMHDGELKFIGEPEECAARYYRLNFEVSRDQADEDLDRQIGAVADSDAARLVRARLTNAEGRTLHNVEQGDPLRLEVVIEAQRDLLKPRFLMHGLSEDGTVVFEFVLGLNRQAEDFLRQGQRVRLAGEIENPLVPGRYMLNCWVRRDGDAGDMAVQAMRLLHFAVYGTSQRYGLVSVRSDFAVEAEP